MHHKSPLGLTQGIKGYVCIFIFSNSGKNCMYRSPSLVIPKFYLCFSLKPFPKHFCYGNGKCRHVIHTQSSFESTIQGSLSYFTANPCNCQKKSNYLTRIINFQELHTMGLAQFHLSLSLSNLETIRRTVFFR